MGIFTEGDDEDDELFDMYMLNEIHKDSGEKDNNTAYSGGGCLTCLLFMIGIPFLVITSCLLVFV